MASAFLLIAAWLRARTPREEGQGLVEYGLILALIAVVGLLTLTDLGSTIAGVFSNLAAPL